MRIVEKYKKLINEEEANMRGWCKKIKKNNNKQVSSFIRYIRVILTKDSFSKNNVVGNIEMDFKKWVEKI